MVNESLWLSLSWRIHYPMLPTGGEWVVSILALPGTNPPNYIDRVCLPFYKQWWRIIETTLFTTTKYFINRNFFFLLNRNWSRIFIEINYRTKLLKFINSRHSGILWLIKSLILDILFILLLFASKGRSYCVL